MLVGFLVIMWVQVAVLAAAVSAYIVAKAIRNEAQPWIPALGFLAVAVAASLVWNMGMYFAAKGLGISPILLATILVLPIAWGAALWQRNVILKLQVPRGTLMAGAAGVTFLVTLLVLLPGIIGSVSAVLQAY